MKTNQLEISRILDASPSLIAEISEVGEVVYLSRACEKILGFSPDSLKGKKWEEVFFGGDAESARACWESVMAACGEKIFVETKTRAADGSFCHLQLVANAVEASDGSFRSLVVNAFEVPKEKKVFGKKRARQGRDEEAQLRGVLDAIPGLVAVKDREGRYCFVNRGMAEAFSMRTEDVIGKTDEECGIPLGQAEELRALGEEVIVSGKAKVFPQQSFLRGDGSLGWFQVTTMPFSFGRQGEGTLTVALDVSENKMLCDDLERAQRLAEEESVRKGEFLADMSHEIRTPMNSVIGFSNLLLDSELTAEQRRHIEVLRNSGEALLLLVNDILDFSKIEEGKLGVEKTVFPLMEKLEEGFDALAIRAAEKKLELIFFPDFSLPGWVEGDSGRLLQIINNLVGNAIKFTEEGTITLRVQMESQDASGILLRFSICDTGIGISQEKQEMLFHRFSQGDSSISRRFGGSGLGLTISRRLAELMGGEIGVVSKEGEGSEFWFTVRVGEASGEEGERAEELQILSGKKALVFDRSEGYREVIQSHLLDWGMEVHGVDSLDALQREICKTKAGGKSYDVVFIDMSVGIKKGEVDVMALWPNSVFSGLRTVNVRPFGQSCTGACKREGYSACIGKPLRHSELGNTLSRLFSFSGSPAVEEGRHRREAGGWNFEKLNGHVLVVEDYLANQILAQALLEKMGMTCDIVHNGRDAIFAIETIGYDLVFMDVQMPVMDGLTAAREIRKKHHDSPERSLPIIAMTAQALPEDRERCLVAGMNDYISKPIEEKILFEVSKKWLMARGKYTNPVFDGEAINGDGAAGRESSFSDNRNEPIYDPAGLKKALGGDPQFIARFLKTFLKGTSADLEKIRDLIASGDFAKVQRIAHNLKGTSGYFHSPQYKSVVEAFEAAIKKGENKKAVGLFSRLEKEYQRLREAVSRDFFAEEGGEF